MLKIARSATISVAGNAARTSSRLLQSDSTAVSYQTCSADFASGYFAARLKSPRLPMTFKDYPSKMLVIDKSLAPDGLDVDEFANAEDRSEEHTSELQS